METNEYSFDYLERIFENIRYIRFSPTYKILLFTFKALNGNCPSYLSSLLHPCDARYNLRSVSHNRLKQPKSTLCNYGDQPFSVAAPRLSNSLPNKIRCCISIPDLKNLLKHIYLLSTFSDCYVCRYFTTRSAYLFYYIFTNSPILILYCIFELSNAVIIIIVITVAESIGRIFIPTAPKSIYRNMSVLS